MGSLGSRLEAALAILEKCGKQKIFADIGSDHAFLAIEAVRRGFTEKAIASDINELPLTRGRENAQKQNVGVEFILSDGFDAFDGRDISAAAICGMGGELIAKMIIRSNAAHKCKLIMQPMSAQEELRKSMWENGFEIKEEIYVTENRKPYTVIFAEYTEKNTDYSYTDLYLGKARTDSDEFAEYCSKIKLAAEKLRKGIVARGGDTAEIDSLISECQMHITSF